MSKRMDPKVKAEWLTALRSGDYEQVQGRLRKTAEDGSKSYCCLGVLEDLSPLRQWLDDDRTVGLDGKTEPEAATLSYMACQWSGLESLSGYINLSPTVNRHFSVSLTELNDNGLTFEQIADVIEYAF